MSKRPVTVQDQENLSWMSLQIQIQQVLIHNPMPAYFPCLSLYLRPRTARRKKTGCDDSGLSSLLTK
jgi:hypothetical protein